MMVVSAIFLARRVNEGMALFFLAQRVIERFQMAESLERTMRLTYNLFRSKHKGMPSKEVSALWKRYKENDYDLPPELLGEAGISETVAEVPRADKEVEVVKKLSTAKTSLKALGVRSYLASRFS